MNRERDDLDRAGDSLRAQLRDAAREMEGADRAARALSGSLGAGLRRALDEAVFGAGRFGDVVRGLALDMARGALRAAVAPVGAAVGDAVGGALTGAVGGLLGGAASAGVRAFAKGGVVERPTAFAMRGGAGLMGEAGPEAILPLARGADGRLGVRGGGGASITLNVTTPDADSFRRAGPQLAKTLARMVDRGRGRL